MEEILKEEEQYEGVEPAVEPMEEPVVQDAPTPVQEEMPEEVAEEEAEVPGEEVPEAEETTLRQLQAVADALVKYGGSGNTESLAQELEQVIEGLLEAHAIEVEQSRKAGMLTFALSQIVHDPGAVMGEIDLDTVDFDLSNLGDLRDFLEPIYQEKPYLFKVINPLRGACIATGVTGNTLPSNGELGALSMEEYTAYRNARGSVSR